MTTGSASSILGGSQPVGSIVQAPYNLTDPAWLPCDGRAVLRATYPKLSACLPSIGTFTVTLRTKSGTPTGNAIANNGTLWVVTTAVGTGNLLTTPDGIAFTGAASPGAADNVRSILHDGTNFVAYNGNASTQNFLYSSTGTGTWTASVSTVTLMTGGTQTCMAWAPSLGTVGRFCAVAGSTNLYTSDDRGVTWTLRSIPNPPGSLYHVCWTGQKFIASSTNASYIGISTDGITWTGQLFPFQISSASATVGSIVSDGNGKVLMVNGGQLFTSLDHGATWTARLIGDVPTSLGVGFVQASCTNGRFIVASLASNVSVVWVSYDLTAWSLVVIGNGNTDNSATFSYKAGVYLCNRSSTQNTVYTLVEDANYMRLPYGNQGAYSWNNFMPFIKVQ